jgi:chemotaxis protein MotA
MSKKAQIDFASLLGVLLGPACVLGGQWIEGGALGSLVQLSAAMIVIGASLGACMLSFAPSSLMAAARDVRKVVASTVPDPFDLIDRIVSYSNVLSKEGPIALQKQIPGEG